ncbi:MAG TPA: alpha/beta hydrolase domain-containing protein [Planctomicrobium sp.]|nr:alpha/beta hydrolase domain-containing protein [Planctomicrobium sp.]
MITSIRSLRFFILVWGLSFCATHYVSAEVTRFEVTQRELFAEGMKFGDAGSYERIVGRVYYEIDPQLPQNQGIIDLEYAPLNARGKVEFSSDLFILAPTDPAKGNGALFYDTNNRGNKLALGQFGSGGGNDPKTRQDAGNGFLYRQGFTVVWNGWNAECLPGNHRLCLTAPVARNADGTPITGLVRYEFFPDRKGLFRCNINQRSPGHQHGSYTPTQSGIDKATLTIRSRPTDERALIPTDQWKFHVKEIADSQLPIVEVELPAGFKRGHVYEVIYETQDALVHGVSFASIRDLISALRHGDGENNPLLVDGKPYIQRCHAYGISQTGRYVREFVYSGFNEDERGGKVFDGIISHVAGGGLGSFNHRFAQPTQSTRDYPSRRFPFTYGETTDSFSGKTDGIMRRSVASNTAPFMMHTQTSNEYWNSAGSLVHTDPQGEHDSPLPDNVRIYTFGGTQHVPAGFPPSTGSGNTESQYPHNPADYRPFLRALLVALDRCVRDGVPAPPSVYPKIADGTLVPFAKSSTGFPDIPGVGYPDEVYENYFLDLGPHWESKRIINNQPPVMKGTYRTLVPRADLDGNDLGCLSPPEVLVPIATYAPWNLNVTASGGQGSRSGRGAYFPFIATKLERQQKGDPRLSLEERYDSLETYMKEFQAACRQLEQAGYLLPEDSEQLCKQHRSRAIKARVGGD